jgi:pimeloyl-ACP methyl ester carboxylesterase
MCASVLSLPSVRRIGTPNPAFDVSRRVIGEACAAMAANQRPLQRPVVLLSGWRSSAPAVNSLARRLCELTSGRPGDFFTVSYPLVSNLEKAVEIAARAIGVRFPGGAPGATAELDVVGISMGGLVARAAAMEPSRARARPRLEISRLFTLATPHRGARLAARFGVDKAARDMRAGSAYLARLDEHLRTATYELVCYARLGDVMVGSTNAAPPGRDPIWVPSAMMLSHLTIAGDTAIAADIARRLRGEAPLAREDGPAPRD